MPCFHKIFKNSSICIKDILIDAICAAISWILSPDWLQNIPVWICIQASSWQNKNKNKIFFKNDLNLLWPLPQSHFVSFGIRQFSLGFCLYGPFYVILLRSSRLSHSKGKKIGRQRYSMKIILLLLQNWFWTIVCCATESFHCIWT